MSKTITLLLAALGGLAVGAFATHQFVTSEPTASEADAIPQLQLGDRHHGEITSDSELNGNDGSRYRRHHLSLEEGELVEISLDGALHGRLALFDPHGQLVGGAEPSATLRRRIDESGDYLLVVSGDDARSFGPFDLSSRPLDLALSDTGELEGESRLDGWLQGEANEHSLAIEEAGLYDIELRSDDFDAFLVLEGDNGLYREDDDSAGDLNARITTFLEPGDYRLISRSFDESSGTEGLYQLEVASKTLSQPLQRDGELPIGGGIHGWYDGSPLHYQLILEEDAIVTLEMRSDDFDTYLELEGQGRHLHDDDGGQGTDSRLRQRLSAGEYTVTPSGYGDDNSGLFELDVNLAPASEPADDEPLPFDTPIQAWLDPGAMNEYVIEIEEAGRYRLDMTSEALDAYLELEGEGLSLYDDDGGNGFDARIQAHLEPGVYRAIARSFDRDDTGPYRLSLVTE
ncbi:MAG: hypothetical protein ACQEUM_10735 [Pseudomonadota bacterium]